MPTSQSGLRRKQNFIWINNKIKTMLDARIRTERELEMENPSIRTMYHRVPFVYAHGELENDRLVYCHQKDDNGIFHD